MQKPIFSNQFLPRNTLTTGLLDSLINPQLKLNRFQSQLVDSIQPMVSNTVPGNSQSNDLHTAENTFFTSGTS